MYTVIETEITKSDMEIEKYISKINSGYQEKPFIDKENGRIILYPEETKIKENQSIYKDCMESLNKITIINLYHFWEKFWVNFIMKSPIYEENYKYPTKHAELMKIISEKYEISSDIEKIKDIANALKHGNTRNIRKIAKIYPDLIKRNDDFFISHFRADALYIKQKDVNDIFETLKASGPRKPIYYLDN